MSVQTTDMRNGQEVKPARKASGANIFKLTAAIAQLLSFLTTLWCVEWIWSDGQPLHRYAAALVIEITLVAMKLTLFNGSGRDDAVGWSGMVIDVILNTGGALPRASLLMTFPPIAVLLQIIGLYTGATYPLATIQEITISHGGGVTALLGGILLAVAPHYLWKRGG